MTWIVADAQYHGLDGIQSSKLSQLLQEDKGDCSLRTQSCKGCKAPAKDFDIVSKCEGRLSVQILSLIPYFHLVCPTAQAD